MRVDYNLLSLAYFFFFFYRNAIFIRHIRHVVFTLCRTSVASSSDPLSPTSAMLRARVRFKASKTRGEKVDPLKITERAATGVRNSEIKAYPPDGPSVRSFRSAASWRLGRASRGPRKKAKRARAAADSLAIGRDSCGSRSERANRWWRLRLSRDRWPATDGFANANACNPDFYILPDAIKPFVGILASVRFSS